MGNFFWGKEYLLLSVMSVTDGTLNYSEHEAGRYIKPVNLVEKMGQVFSLICLPYRIRYGVLCCYVC